MPGPDTQITDSEKAAILAYCYGIFGTWKETFLAAEAGKPNNRKAESLQTTVGRWKNSPKVVKYTEFFTRLIADRDADARQRGREEAQKAAEDKTSTGESKHTTTTPKIDYNDPKARRQLYNKIIQEASDDPRTQLDAAKLIEQTQRDDKQAARDQQIQRFYTPVSCRSCPMYEKAIQRRTKTGK